MTTPPALQAPGDKSSSRRHSLRASPGEPTLSIDPETATFITSGGRSEHMLVNCGDARLAVKVRCSDNNVYRVNPVYMFVEAGQCTSLMVTRLPGPPKVDKLVLHYVACAESEQSAKELFKPGISPDVLKLQLTCCNPEDVPSVRGSSKSTIHSSAASQANI
ncbi:hypothetical protein QR680_006402 [Steinernema hermaphroditum]|uniref:Major sperm protein n=1 Tax=Steinernema hermaphroditum TaxID=289476 RepID=A0AA39LXC4_9BILA|nr:hypothetical protein QR680_006380 [Steinernema hermaphroditum]KAK0412774.1 hypothetical protein QR680_006402 [Steinernema hermaphroditum]